MHFYTSQGEKLKVFYNPAANKLVPNEEFGIAFNGILVSIVLTGSGGADPDLLLIYGPTRCHLGFPAWRLRYTEIV